MSSYDRAVLVQGQYTAGAFTLADGMRAFVPLDVNGNLKVVLAAGSISIGTVAIDQTTPGTTNGVVTKPLFVTPAAGTVSSITTGGTAVTVITGPINGGYLTNPINLSAQGIAAAENLYVDPVGTPGSTDANGNGTTVILVPGQNYTIPALAATKTLKANAATSGHKFTVVVF